MSQAKEKGQNCIHLGNSNKNKKNIILMLLCLYSCNVNTTVEICIWKNFQRISSYFYNCKCCFFHCFALLHAFILFSKSFIFFSCIHVLLTSIIRHLIIISCSDTNLFLVTSQSIRSCWGYKSEWLIAHYPWRFQLFIAAM